MPFIGNRRTSETAAVTSNLPDVASITDDLSTSQFSKMARRFSLSTALPFSVAPRSRRYMKKEAVEDCPKGQIYYACRSTGFKGCCSENACDPKVVCPELDNSKSATSKDPSSEPTSKSIADTATSASTEATSLDDTSTKSSRRETRTVESSITSAKGTPLQAAMNATALPAIEDVALAPSCPSNNGTRYTDNANTAYTVRCGYDSTATSFNSFQIESGGYAQCFSNCSSNNECHGFTFVGVDDGTCYFKERMLRSQYTTKEGNNYISCNKVDRLASAPNATTSDIATSTPSAEASTGQPNKGAIAGGVVGGIAVIAFVLFLIAFLARRRRKNIESKRATVTHIFGGAMQPSRRREEDDPNALPLHTRNGSTSHDLFAPFGGYQRNTDSTVARDYATQSQTASPSSNKSPLKAMYADSMPSHPTSDVKSPGPFLLPATTYQPEKHSSTEPMLDSTPVQRTKSRSLRFHEHIAEMADTSSPPPTLTPPGVSKKRWGSVLYADTKAPNFGSAQSNLALSGNDGRLEEARRRQQQLHLMSWNNYDEGRAAAPHCDTAGLAATIGEKPRPAERGPARKEGDHQVSPEETDSPVDLTFNMSPLGSMAVRR